MRYAIPVPPNRFETYAGWFYWGFQLLFLPVILMLLLEAVGRTVNEAQLNFIYFCVNFIVATLLLGRLFIYSVKQGFIRPGYTFQSAALGLAGVQGSNVLFSLVILRLKPDFANVNDSNIGEMVAEHYGMMALGTVFLVPVVEELLYRGVIFGCLYNRSKVAAYIVSTALFSAVHILGYITMYDPVTLLLCFLQYIPAGMCLGWAYARSGSLLAPILIHMTINQIAMLAMR